MAQHKARILLVDDDTAIVHTIARYLSSLGYEVSATDQPAHALGEAVEHGARFDLLITDIMMPKMEGHVLANHLREVIPDLAVILVSGYPEAGVDVSQRVRYLPKPFGLELLVATIEDVLATEPSGNTGTIDLYYESSQAMAEIRALLASDLSPV